MTPDQLYQELKDLEPAEVETVSRLVQALKRTRQSPLAYIEEIMKFETLDHDPEQDVYVHRMTVSDELKNRFHMLHGGVTATFIDTAMGSVVLQLEGDGAKAVTMNLHVHFLAPATEGRLTAETRVVKRGRTVTLLETRVTDERNRLIATASSTFFRLKQVEESP
ncbi:PaaI family thioesterase [Staphylospora marina]|uniref:PaaI family thioesterase n=1 Tax=Staphylospora marina TaxID=2490858 RepID=UPI0013DE018F|nr:PaaI family thioesterase [Staphylospora marina]